MFRAPTDDKLPEEPSLNPPEAQQFLIISNSSTLDHDENIITSATSSFVSESPEESKEEIAQKKGGFKNLNSISDDEPKKLNKLITSKEEPFIKTYVKSLSNDVDDDQLVYVKSSTTTTELPVEVSTEENEAKIEQVSHTHTFF